MKTLPFEIDDMAGSTGQAFVITGESVFHACRSCATKFPQTDEGWSALKDHEFENHERIRHYDWSELHGQEVTILVVERIDNSDQWLYPGGYKQVELVARAKDGTYYFLPFSHYHHDKEGDFKWKPQRNGTARLQEISSEPTPSGPALPLLGSDAMAESSARATASKTAARVGSRSTGRSGKKISVSGAPYDAAPPARA